mgnify:CR=1 FL=1
MKRKIFSKLLMVALVIAAVGSFVSCKDYDDDINNLQKQIDAKAALSELTALQSTLDSKIAAAQSAATAAQAKADAAATKTSVDELKKALETAIADAKKAGTDAGTQAGTAIAAANKAQETADGAAAAAKKADEDAKAALADALKTIEETYQTKAAAAEAAEALAAVKATADAAFTKAEAEELKAELDGLKESLESSIDEKIAAAIAELDNATASVEAIWKAVTSVEVYTQNAAAADEFARYDARLDFRHATIAQDATFGDEETWNAVPEADQIKFLKDDSVKFNNELLIRVNPANASFTKDQIRIENSKGEALNPTYITIGDPVRFDDLLTRAGEVKNTLWRIPVALNKGVTDADLKKVLRSGDRDVVFAVAINMTDDIDAERYVYSSFEVRAEFGDYLPTNTFDFKVNGDLATTLKNRWDAVNEVVIAEDGAKSSKNPELTWAADNDDHPTPAYSLVSTPAKNKNFVTDEDGRYNLTKYAEVEVGDEIVITAMNTLIANDHRIAYYYAALDSVNAIESNPSEYEAWEKYGITGLGEMKKANETLRIGFPKGDGDIVGIRVYAVNYDGTLADPDGRAFYVQIGQPAQAGKATVSGTWKAVANASGIAAGAAAGTILDAKNNVTAIIDIPDYSDFEYLVYDTHGRITLPAGTKEGDTQVIYGGGVNVDYVLLGSDSKTVTNWNKAQKIKFVVNNAGNWLDKASLSFAIEGRDNDANDRLINKINVTLTKQMPDGETAGMTWKAGADVSADKSALNMHMFPDNSVTKAAILAANLADPADNAVTTATASGNWYEAATYGVADFADYFTLSNEYAWNIEVKGADIDKTTRATAYGTTNGFKAYDYNIAQAVGAVAPTNTISVIAGDREMDLTGTAGKWEAARWNGIVGNGTGYATTVSRVYANISCRDLNKNNTIEAATEVAINYNAKAAEFNTYFIDDMKTNATWRGLNYQYVSDLTTAGKNIWSTTGLVIRYATAATPFIEPEYTSLVAGDAADVKAPGVTIGEYFLTDADAKAGLFGCAWPMTPGGTDDVNTLHPVTDNLPSFVVGNNPWVAGLGAADAAFPGVTAASGFYVFGGLIEEINGTKTLNTRTFNVRLVGGEDYYTSVTCSGAGALTIVPDPTRPAAIATNINAKLKVTALTAFGNEVTVVEVPVKILK